MQTFNTLIQMMAAFPDEQTAIDHFTAIRWKSGSFCPYCGSVRVYHFSDKRTHKCADCRKRFSIKVGTIFEDSKIELRVWLMAIWLITSHKKGIASTQLAKDLGVTQKTAWFMTQRLRYAIRTKSFNAPLDGDVEVDEMYHGGKERNKHASKRKGGTQGGAGKIAVLGILQRSGELRTAISVNASPAKAEILRNAIKANVRIGSNLMTDSDKAFRRLGSIYNHERVNHGIGEYVRGDFHTNGIESVWALFKRQIIGTHHFLSAKHFGRYLGEMTWRFNERNTGEGNRVNALLALSNGRLTYKELIA
jgi:transposase-like protein